MKKTGLVKITSGLYKGEKIATPGDGTHPMGERERIALFNMVGNDLTGRNVLDAYAGGGTLGIEAMSRWAFQVVFVEKSAKAASLIQKNLDGIELYGIPEYEKNYYIIRGDVRDFKSKMLFRLVLVDPPYDKFETEGAEHLVQFMTDDGLLVLSHPGEAPEIKGLKLSKTRKYAGAHLSVYVK